MIQYFTHRIFIPDSVGVHGHLVFGAFFCFFFNLE